MDMVVSSEVCGSFNQIQMNLALIPCEIFRDLRLCVCVKPNRAEREFDLGDLERDRLVAVFMSD